MRKISIMIMTLGLLLIPIIIFSLQLGIHSHLTHWAYNGNTITLGWNESVGADMYEVRVQHVETEQIFIVGETSGLSINYILPKTGHYIFRVRAMNDYGSSDWAYTTNPENVADGNTFWIYSQIPPVTGVIID